MSEAVAKPVKSRWNNANYVKVYELAKSGLSDAQIAAAVGHTSEWFSKLTKRNPALKDAVDRGRNGSAESRHADFRDYVYHRLPPELQEIWDRINLCDESPCGYIRIKALLGGTSCAARQHLYLYALVATGFNASEACRKLCLSFRTVQSWAYQDPDFGALVDEIHWHKKNYFEAHLIQRVAEGDPSCTIFVNRTLNADRGYREVKHKEVNHSGEVGHHHAHAHAHLVIPIDQLDLQAGSAEALLDAMQARLGVKEGEDPALPQTPR